MMVDTPPRKDDVHAPLLRGPFHLGLGRLLACERASMTAPFE